MANRRSSTRVPTKDLATAQQKRNYRPISIYPDDWDQVREFVVTHVLRVEMGRAMSTNCMKWLAEASLWHLRRGGSLDIEEILHPKSVELFLAHLITRGEHVDIGAVRSRLGTLGRKLTVRAPWDPPKVQAPRTKLSPPYDVHDLRAIERDSRLQTTRTRSQLAEGLSLLILGTGMPTSVARRLSGSDVHHRPEGTVVLDPQEQREWVVRDRYAARLVELARNAGEGPIIGSRASGDSIYKILATVRIAGGRVPFELKRLRATWVVAQVSAGTHILVILDTYGAQFMAALDDHLPYFERPTAADAAAQLRRA